MRFLFAAILCILARQAGALTPEQERIPREVDAPDARLAKILLLAGSPSNKPGQHEYFAGCALMMPWLKANTGVWPVLVADGWPRDERVLDGARAVVCYMDGAAKLPFLAPERWEKLQRLVTGGAGLVMLHQAVDVPPAKADVIRGWLGGVWQSDIGSRGHWDMEFSRFPEHPILRGVEPFAAPLDGWLFNLHFAPHGVTPLLAAPVPDKVRTTPDAKAHAGRDEVVAWAFERPGGGRAFAFTGCDLHRNWGVESQRRFVVNGILWAAGREVPLGGAAVALAAEDLTRYFDDKRPTDKRAPAALIAAPPRQDLATDLTLHRLLIDGENWQIVADALGFADAPCTDEAGNFYFSDMRAPAIYKVAADGTRTKLADEPASGLKFGPDGRLYACQGVKKRLIALEPGGKVDVIAEDVQPNDLVVSHRGHVYLTETGKHQVTFVDLQTGQKHAADTGITAPNGIALSPDQGTLAVSDYKGAHVWAFRVEANGSLAGKAPYMTMRLPIDPIGEFKFNESPPYRKESGGDGMTSDTIGRYYVATTLGVQVFDPTGRECGLLPKPDPKKPVTSCALAGPGRGYLYITQGDRIFRRKVQAIGNVFLQAAPAAPAATPGK